MRYMYKKKAISLYPSVFSVVLFEEPLTMVGVILEMILGVVLQGLSDSAELLGSTSGFQGATAFGTKVGKTKKNFIKARLNALEASSTNSQMARRCMACLVQLQFFIS